MGNRPIQEFGAGRQRLGLRGSTRAALRRMSDKGPRAGISAVRVMVGYVSEKGGVVWPEQSECDGMLRATGARIARGAGVVRGRAAAQRLAAAIEATPSPLTPGVQIR